MDNKKRLHWNHSSIGYKKNCKKETLLKKDVYTHLNLVNNKEIPRKMKITKIIIIQNTYFYKLLEMIQPFLTKQDSCIREAITAEAKLAITLQYFDTGRNMNDLRFSAIMFIAAIGQAIMEICETLLYCLQSFIQVSEIKNYYLIFFILYL